MILVTGQPRSGTTAVARMLHHLGCPMGYSMAMPLPAPGTDYDFEDWHAIQRISQHGGLGSWWEGYVAGRRFQHRSFSAAGVAVAAHWGVKSPAFLPHVAELRNLTDEPVHVVLCTRSADQRRASAEKQFEAFENASQALAMVTELARFTVENPDLVVTFEDLRSSDAVAHALASLCGSKQDPTQVYLQVARHWA